MTDTLDIKITTTKHSRLQETDFNNLPFGHTFADHMFMSDYKDDVWNNARIEPYGQVPMSPSTSLRTLIKRSTEYSS